MSDQGSDPRLDELQGRIDQERDDLAEMEGTDDEPRFSDDGMIEKGAGNDSIAPPG
jgi:hypothetical protein